MLRSMKAMYEISLKVVLPVINSLAGLVIDLTELFSFWDFFLGLGCFRLETA